ncbi:MAG: four helix bundle protein [Thermomicrobiales bacterium]
MDEIELERVPIKKFEDILAWKHARILARMVYRESLNSKMARDFGFIDQFRRASVSVMNNIAEGYERESNAEFSRFLAIAKGSSGEVRSMLYLAVDIGYVDSDAFMSLKSQTDETIRVIVGLRRSVELRIKRSNP